MKDRKPQTGRQRRNAAPVADEGGRDRPAGRAGAPATFEADHGAHRNGTNGKGDPTSLGQTEGKNGRGPKPRSGPAPEDAPAPAVLPDMLLNPVPPTPDADDDTETGQPPGRRPRPADRVLQHPFWLLTNDPPRTLFVPLWVLGVAEEANEILVLAQLNYWFRLDGDEHLRAKVEFDGHVWVAKTHADLGAEVRRNERQVEKAIRGLKREGFVLVEHRRSRFYHGQAVSHFRLDWDAIAAASRTAAQKWEGQGHEPDLL